ncbi:MAG: DUF1631 domain-containing protein [Candidatus Polarisedimenticolaceae bacterium]|nr:DUF1631 domain-containing protein [Candidatus Polarisedimenticolaceae bacterium]
MIYLKMLPPLLTSLFEKLDDSLYELSDKSSSDEQQASYFEAMREMRKARVRIETQFKRNIAVEFDRFWSHGPDNRQSFSGDGDGLSMELSLLDEDSLEETLAVTSLIAKGENSFQRDLEALHERFGHILKRDDINHQNNPVSPAIISHVFHELLTPVSVDLPIKLVIYKLFDKYVMCYVGSIYDEINQQLKKDGILTKLTLRVRQNPAAPTRHVDAPVQHAVVESSEVQAEMFHAFQRLIGQRNQAGGLSPGAPIVGRALPTVETVKLLDTLSALQSCNITLIANVSGSDGQNDLRQTLVNSLQLAPDGQPSKTLNKIDNNTIDVVSMLFEYIFDDPNMPDPMKVLIGRLQIPMLKIALADQHFFSEKGHPARCLLNSIARAAVGWSDDGDRSENSLYGVVERMIKLILKEFELDAGLFKQLNDDFAAFFSMEERGAEVTEERTNQVVRGKEQLKVAKMRAASEISNRLGSYRDLPEVAQTLLNDAWKDVLLLLYLRQGIDSDAWAKSLETMDVLLWSVELKNDLADRKAMLKKIPGLLRTLREGLAEISYDQHKMARLFKSLQQSHIRCMKGEMGAVKVVKVVKKASAEAAEAPGLYAERDSGGLADEIVIDSNLSPNSAMLDDVVDLELPKHDEFYDRANAVKMGTWIELLAEDGTTSRIKLSWRSEVTGICVFVNRRGVKVKEMMVEAFAELIRKRAVIILKHAAVPLMDRALDAMMNALKKTEASVAVR